MDINYLFLLVLLFLTGCTPGTLNGKPKDSDNYYKQTNNNPFTAIDYGYGYNYKINTQNEALYNINSHLKPKIKLNNTEKNHKKQVYIS